MPLLLIQNYWLNLPNVTLSEEFKLETCQSGQLLVVDDKRIGISSVVIYLLYTQMYKYN